MRRWVNRWSEVISYVPCGGSGGDPAGQLLISAELRRIDGVNGILGSAGPTRVWDGCPTISSRGEMEFDSDDIAGMESDGTFEGVILHEMGHVIGVGYVRCCRCYLLLFQSVRWLTRVGLATQYFVPVPYVELIDFVVYSMLRY